MLKAVLLSGSLALLSAACSNQTQAAAVVGEAGQPSSNPVASGINKTVDLKASDLKLGPTSQSASQPAAAPQSARAAVSQPARVPATQTAKPATDGLPPISYICTMPGDEAILEDKPGKCPNPKCGMELKPIRIVQAWSCLNNTAFIQENPGKCITDKTDLVPIAASMFWACSNTPDKHELNPVKCADGKDSVKKFEVRPHGDHNPRHGGQLFMADDAWHHLEGTYPSAGLFRVFFYDDWTKPLTPTGFVARTVVKDAAGKDVATVPLKMGRLNTMEAQIPNAMLPLSMQLHVTFKPGEREKLFDFQFKELTKEPVAPVPTAAVRAPTAPTTQASAQPPRSAPAPQGRGTAPAGQGRGATSPTPAPRPAPQTPPASAGQPSPFMAGDPLPPTGNQLELMSPIIPQEDPIPATSKEILAELTVKSDQLATELGDGTSLAQLWVPALRTKNLALALVNSHLNELPNPQRVVAENAANRLVRAAWAIDNLGDLGDKEKIVAVHAVFAAAVSDLKGAYASAR